MNRWEKQLGDHPIHETLDSVRGFVETKHKDLDADTELEKRRILKFFTSLEEVINDLDPEAAPFSLLDSINSQLRHQNIWNQLSSYATNSAISYLTNANNAVNPLLGQLSQFPNANLVMPDKAQMKSLEKLFDDFVSNVTEIKTSFSKDLKSLADEHGALSTKLTQLSTQADARKTETDLLISDWQKQFSDAQESRAKDYADWRKTTSDEFETRAGELIKESNAKIEKSYQSFSSSINGYKSEAKIKHAEILDLHGIVAGDSVAAGYISNADNEKKQAGFWRWGSIAFIVATALWTGVSYFLGADVSGPGYWGQALKALSVAGVLLFGAVYASKQSNVHRVNEQRTRWLALEVKAIDPFIASLKPDEQTELKKILSEKIFGQMNGENSPEESAVNEHVFNIIAKGFADVIKANK